MRAYAKVCKHASKGVEVRVAYLNLDPGATCKVSDGAATGGKQEMLRLSSMGQKIRNSWCGGGIFRLWWGMRGQQHPKSTQEVQHHRDDCCRFCHNLPQFFFVQCWNKLELRISGACKVALPEASSAVTPSVPKALLQCGAYLDWGSQNCLADNCSRES